MRRPTKRLCGWFLAGAWLAWASPALAQAPSGFGSGSSGNSPGGSFSGNSSGGGFGGSSSGSSFGGGFSGNSFSGSSGGSFSGSSGGSFTGGNGFGGGGTGTGMGGNPFQTYAGAAAASTGVTTYTVAPSNPFVTYYLNPLALGLPGSTGQANFGRPLYTINTLTQGGTAGGITGTFNTQGGGYSQGGSSTLSGYGGAPLTAYVAVPDDSGPLVTSGKVLTEVRQVLERSNSLPSKDSIRVLMKGDTIVLQGTVTDVHERRLAAALIGLTPGVHGIDNELIVKGPPFLPTSP